MADDPDLEVVPDLPELSVDEVARRLGEPGFFVYDTNSPGRWRRSRVATARNVDPYDLALEALPPDRGATLVFYCSGPG